MIKFLARFLILMLGFGACGKSIYASTVLLSAETENRHDSNVSVVTSLDGISPALHEPDIVARSPEHNGEAESTPNGQASPGAGQNPPQHHSHHVRNILIGAAVIFAFGIIFAVAAK